MFFGLDDDFVHDLLSLFVFDFHGDGDGLFLVEGGEDNFEGQVAFVGGFLFLGFFGVFLPTSDDGWFAFDLFHLHGFDVVGIFESGFIFLFVFAGRGIVCEREFGSFFFVSQIVGFIFLVVAGLVAGGDRLVFVLGVGSHGKE